MIENQPAVVFGVVAELWAYISNLDSFARQVVLSAPDLDHERVNAKIVSVHKTLRKDDCMVGPQTQTARPVLGARHSGRVDHKLICLHVQGRSRLDTCNVGTMT